MPLIQNFEIPAGNDEAVVDSIDDVNMTGCTVYWRVFEQEYGIPLPDVEPIIEKSSAPGEGITVYESPPQFVISLDRADTIDLLRNYYHEAVIVDDQGAHITVTYGIMTVTQTEIRNEV